MRNNSEFLENLRAMQRHCARNGSDVGEYWKFLSKKITAQVEVSGEPPLSPSCFYAPGFSGAPFNGIKEVSRLIEKNRSPFWLKAQNLLVRLWEHLPRPLLAPPLRWLFRREMLPYYAQQSSYNYDVLVRYAHVASREQVRSYKLRSPDFYGVDLVDIEDTRLSFKTLRDFNIFLRFNELMSPESKVVVEIGAGIGELARIFLATGRASRYIIVDIPPALAFSQALLSSEFGSERLSLFAPDRGPIGFSDDKLCYFLTPDQLGCLPDFDLGVNLASFGELSRKIVSEYIGALKLRNFREFISINQRLRKSNNPEIIGEKEYAELFGPQMRIARKASYYDPLFELPPDTPNTQGYQLLHFVADDQNQRRSP